MIRTLIWCIGVAAMIAVASAFASRAEAQILRAGASPIEKCAVVNTALERLTGTPSTTASSPALATQQEAVSTTYAGDVVPGRGFEISEGTISGDTRFGATFVGDVGGGLPGVLFTSVNYTPPSPGAGVTNFVVGGEWALCGSWGTLSGTFTDGTVQWNADGTRADVVAKMTVLGGSVNGAAVSEGGGTFSGVLDHAPLAQGMPPTVGGTLDLQTSRLPATTAPAPLPDTGGPALLLGPLVGALLTSSGIAGLLFVTGRKESKS